MTTIFPSPNEQYLLELTNRIRLDPSNELNRILLSRDKEVSNALDYFGTDLSVLRQQWTTLEPAPPLAWSGELHNSAETHNQRTIAADTQSHFLPNEPGLIDRIREAGYDPSSVAENIFAYPESIEAAHAGFAIDWGVGPHGIQEPAGHRISMTNSLYREVGIDITEERDPNTSVGTFVVTQHFGIDRNAIWGMSDAYLVGVVYDDTIRDDNFYTPGEGRGDVTITVADLVNDRVFSTTTWEAGGYQIALPKGQYRVDFQADWNNDGAIEIVSRQIAMGDDNLKLDLVADPEELKDSMTPAPTNADLGTTATPTAINDTRFPLSHDMSYDDILLLELDVPSGIEPLELETLNPDSYADHSSDLRDVIFGLPMSDTIIGAGGNDYIAGDNGDDTLFGNRGDDGILGGEGDDVIFGGRGHDAIDAGNNNDIVMADYGDDTIVGGDGSDTLFGNDGADQIDGGSGNDYLLGGLDNDTLLGSAGDDQLNGQLGDDTLLGGGGQDQFVLMEDSGYDVIVDFNDGIDVIGLMDLTIGQLSISPHPKGLTIMAPGGSMTLLGIDRGQIDANDFVSLS
ncbi:MAG: hypothetical protein EAZ61_10285 [Oscillatoriales cyanobacterium]|nr:MAG: hypothetical protein EAZ61_10285 [Oscillatoriales cyanobacterium]